MTPQIDANFGSHSARVAVQARNLSRSRFRSDPEMVRYDTTADVGGGTADEQCNHAAPFVEQLFLVSLGLIGRSQRVA